MTTIENCVEVLGSEMKKYKEAVMKSVTARMTEEISTRCRSACSFPITELATEIERCRRHPLRRTV